MNRDSYLIVMSSTKGWNVGDEFIQAGVKNLFEAALPHPVTYVLFNRNPEVRKSLDFLNPLRRISLRNKLVNLLSNFLRIGFLDNSLKPTHPLSSVDFVVMAGTPEWCSLRVVPLLKSAYEAGISVLFVGIGLWTDPSKVKLRPVVRKVLHSSPLITVRDRNTLELLAPFGAELLPCPSLFASRDEKTINEVKTIGIVYGTSRSEHAVPKQVELSAVRLFDELCDKFNVRVIVHYIDDFFSALSHFPRNAIYYSHDWTDYKTFYLECDAVITTRVHGAGFAASMSIPSIVIKHSSRMDTCQGFLSKIVEPDQVSAGCVLQYLRKDVVIQWNRELVRHKKNAFNAYCCLLRQKLEKMR